MAITGTHAPERDSDGVNRVKSGVEPGGPLRILAFGPLKLALTLTRNGALAAVRLPAEPPAGLSASDLGQALRALHQIPIVHTDSAAKQAFQTALCQIAPGSTASYGALAARLQTSPRAVASRCAANPILLRIPCHRVTAKTHPGGFQAGPAWKSLLLRLEAELSSHSKI